MTRSTLKIISITVAITFFFVSVREGSARTMKFNRETLASRSIDSKTARDAIQAEKAIPRTASFEEVMTSLHEIPLVGKIAMKLEMTSEILALEMIRSGAKEPYGAIEKYFDRKKSPHQIRIEQKRPISLLAIGLAFTFSLFSFLYMIRFFDSFESSSFFSFLSPFLEWQFLVMIVPMFVAYLIAREINSGINEERHAVQELEEAAVAVRSILQADIGGVVDIERTLGLTDGTFYYYAIPAINQIYRGNWRMGASYFQALVNERLGWRKASEALLIDLSWIAVRAQNERVLRSIHFILRDQFRDVATYFVSSQRKNGPKQRYGTRQRVAFRSETPEFFLEKVESLLRERKLKMVGGELNIPPALQYIRGMAAESIHFGLVVGQIDESKEGKQFLRIQFIRASDQDVNSVSHMDIPLEEDVDEVSFVVYQSA